VAQAQGRFAEAAAIARQGFARRTACAMSSAAASLGSLVAATLDQPVSACLPLIDEAIAPRR